MEPVKEIPKRIGFWINEKKCKKLDVPEFVAECRKLNMEVIKLDLQKPLADQGPFDVILHKITPIYAQALDGNQEACRQALLFEQYLLSVPHVPVVDPVPGVHTLLHRPATYALLHALTSSHKQVMTPPYVELPDTDMETKKILLAEAGVTFPIVCKPVFGCGGTAAHELAVVLSASRMAEWEGPCVAQSFVQHGAVLYKLYVLGRTWHLVVRPSLKNFRATDAPTVHFNSAKVSKAGSCSPLTQLDQSDREIQHPQPDNSVFDRIVRAVRASISMDLLGIDVVIDSVTGQYAIIDLNPFPSYDSIVEFLPSLASLLHERAQQRREAQECTSSISDLLPPLNCRRQDSSGIDIDTLLRARGHLLYVNQVSTNGDDNCQPFSLNQHNQLTLVNASDKQDHEKFCKISCDGMDRSDINRTSLENLPLQQETKLLSSSPKNIKINSSNSFVDKNVNGKSSSNGLNGSINAADEDYITEIDSVNCKDLHVCSNCLELNGSSNRLNDINGRAVSNGVTVTSGNTSIIQKKSEAQLVSGTNSTKKSKALKKFNNATIENDFNCQNNCQKNFSGNENFEIQDMQNELNVESRRICGTPEAHGNVCDRLNSFIYCEDCSEISGGIGCEACSLLTVVSKVSIASSELLTDEFSLADNSSSSSVSSYSSPALSLNTDSPPHHHR